MSLTATDLLEIRSILKDELASQLDPIKGDIEALNNDIKEIYKMLSDLQKEVVSKDTFKKSSLEEKILRLHTELVEAAKQANVILPSH